MRTINFKEMQSVIGGGGDTPPIFDPPSRFASAPGDFSYADVMSAATQSAGLGAAAQSV